MYGITARGEQLFEELLAAETQSNDDERIFNLRLAFARYLPPDARLGMLERRRAHLVERLVQLRARVKAARDSYARSLVEHDQEAAEHDLTWIERLIAAERAARQATVATAGTATAGTATVGTVTAGTATVGTVTAGTAGLPESLAGPVREQGGNRRAGVDLPTISGLRPAPDPLRPEEDTEQ